MPIQDGRLVFETLVQSSTVDLFHSTGIAVAPLPPFRLDVERLTTQDLMAMITFSGRGMSGTLGLLMPTSVFDLVKQNPQRRYAGQEWIRESVNQLLGRIKARLLQFQVTLQIGLPVQMTPKSLQQLTAQGIVAVYRFRTLRGEISVTLSGKIDYSVLEYSGKTSFATEGDIILF